MTVYLGLTEGVVQKTYQQLWRYIVIKRETAAVGNLILVGIQSKFFYQVVNKFGCLFSSSILLPRVSSKLVKQTFGKDILTVLENRFQHLINGMGNTENGDGIRRGLLLLGAWLAAFYTCLGKCPVPFANELIFGIHHQG